MANALIAVIEDEATIAASVSARLESEGFRVETAADGPTGVELCRRVAPDLVILDLMLPGMDGIEVCRQIQATDHVPVIMLTALDSETDKLIGLGVGADDYMTKPFSVRELVARVKALLRRVNREDETSHPLRIGELEIDPARRRTTVGGSEVHLTPLEFDLLRTLAARPGMVYTRQQLMEEIWGYADGPASRTVDSHVRSLRSKVGPQLIRTVHGVGYALSEPETS